MRKLFPLKVKYTNNPLSQHEIKKIFDTHNTGTTKVNHFKCRHLLVQKFVKEYSMNETPAKFILLFYIADLTIEQGGQSTTKL